MFPNSGLKKVDFEFNGQDPKFLRNGCVCGVSCGMVGHGRDDTGMYESVLLP